MTTPTHTRMIPTTWRASAAAAALLLAGAGSLAQGTAPSGPAPDSPGAAVGATRSSMERADRSFVEKAAVGSMAEVELGKMAQQKAADPQVKAFGERMVQDHGKAHEELTRIGSSKGVTLPATMDRSHRRDAERLAKLSGAEFDREYMKHMVDDHRNDVKEFEKASRSSKDTEVKDFASRTLPTLQTHLQLAENAYNSVRSKKGSDKSTSEKTSAATPTTATR